jgi:hypothetical protein
MTNKPKKSVINYSTNKLETAKLTHKVGGLLDDAVPKNILGMISLCEEHENSLVFYKRWHLIPIGKHNYTVVDGFSNTVVYKHVSLFISALHIIYYLNKKISTTAPKDQLIYALDQEYYRCIENIKFFKQKSVNIDPEKSLLFSSRLENSYFKLDEIKTQLSKVY